MTRAPLQAWPCASVWVLLVSSWTGLVLRTWVGLLPPSSLLPPLRPVPPTPVGAPECIQGQSRQNDQEGTRGGVSHTLFMKLRAPMASQDWTAVVLSCPSPAQPLFLFSGKAGLAVSAPAARGAPPSALTNVLSRVWPRLLGKRLPFFTHLIAIFIVINVAKCDTLL